ncbi:TPA: type II secretion system F family protein [Candidatus Ventrenecus avicola]|nr:type II secretion system F family protein [Candidatus Ventrenecus avicola]
MEGTVQQTNNHLKPLKYPGLGLFMSFKIIFEILLYILKCALRGFLYVFRDLPVMAWRKMSGTVDDAYRGTQAALSHHAKPQENTANKKSILNMDINDLLKNSHYMKKKFAKLEKEKETLLAELQGPGRIRSKEAKVYKFTAKNKDGKLETGIISGFSKLDINTFLVQDGYDVYKIENNKYIELFYGQSSIFAPKLKTKDLLFWLTQLSTYLKSGITLAESIRILNLQMNKKATYKRAFQSVIYELTMGETFSTALEKQGTMFPPLLINMLKAAEATGELQETLDDMANYYEEIDKTHKQMISAMTYPTVIFIFSLAVITFVLVWVIPNFITIYESSGSEIRGITLLVIHISDFLQHNLAFLLLGIAIFIIIFVICYKKIKVFRVKTQTIAMKLPIIGDIIKYNELTIFSKTFSSLLRNNVFITESIDILSKITNNEIYKEIMYNTIDNVVKGEKISLAFKDHWAVPDVAYYMIVTGESTGQLAEMMAKVSAYYQEMHRNIINNMKSFIEPILICFLAIVVGGIIIAVIVPMFDLMNQIQ